MNSSRDHQPSTPVEPVSFLKTYLERRSPETCTVVFVRDDVMERYRLDKGPAFEAYRRAFSAPTAQAFVRDRPVHLDVGTTTLCNLQCEMCTRTINRIQEQPVVMETGLYRRILDDARSLGAVSIKLNAQDEPLMNPRLADHVRWAKEAGFIETAINTNAVLLTPERFEALMDAGLDRLHISFDSHHPQEYERIRRGARFDRVRRNIEQAYDRRNRHGAVTPVFRISKITYHDRRDEVPEFVELFQGCCDEIMSGDVFDYRWFQEDRLPLEGISERELAVHDIFCLDPLRRMLVTAEGEVYPCCQLASTGHVMGNVNDRSLIEIWNAPKFKAYRRLHAQGGYLAQKTCATCLSCRMSIL